MPQEIDEIGAELVRVRNGAGPDHQSDMRSLERLYARAIDAQVQAERARDDARAECQRLLEENRAIKARIREIASWAGSSAEDSEDEHAGCLCHAEEKLLEAIA